MRWSPESGHVPRGFYGAFGDLSEVRLVMVLAEPGNPGGNAIHNGIDSAFSEAEQCYLRAGGQGHTNVRTIIRRCFPKLTLQETMRKVWITESVLCSATTPGAKVDRSCEQLCVSTYLEPQLRLFPNATVAAMGSKAYKRLKKYVPDIVECGAVFPPGCNFPSTKAKWDKLVSIVRSTTGETKGEGQKPHLHGEVTSERAVTSVEEAVVASHRLEGVELAEHLARTFASQLPGISEVGLPAAKNPVRWHVRHPALTRLHGAKANIIALWVNKSEVQVLIRYIKIPGVATVPDRLGTPKLRVRLDDYTEHELTEYFKDLGRRTAGVLRSHEVVSLRKSWSHWTNSPLRRETIPRRNPSSAITKSGESREMTENAKFSKYTHRTRAMQPKRPGRKKQNYTVVLDPVLKARVERKLKRKQGQTFSGLITELLQNHVAP